MSRDVAEVGWLGSFLMAHHQIKGLLVPHEGYRDRTRCEWYLSRDKKDAAKPSLFSYDKI